MKALVVLAAALALVASDGIEEFTASTQQFSADVYKQLVADNANFAFSPLSLETLLGVIQSGAVEETGDEIRTGLHFPSTKEETEEVIKTALPIIEDDVQTLAAVTKLVINTGTLNEDFATVASDVYQVVLIQTLQRLNLVKNYAVLDGTVNIVLSNDLSFDQSWAVPFDKASTKEIPFYTAEDESVDVVAMYQESAELNYFESEDLGVQILELPFENEVSSLTIVLPIEKEGLADLESQIEQVLATPEYTKETVEVVLPKFQIPSSIEFTEVLKTLGIVKVFDSAEADLSGIAGEKGDVYLRKIKQQIYIDVNEDGVGAAVDTRIDAYSNVVKTAAATKTFTADRPFVFYIKVHDVIVYEGRVVLPEY